MKNMPRDIESPCIRNCCLNDENVCMGCYRSLTEIMEWGQASNEERRNILVQAMRRRNSYHIQRVRERKIGFRCGI